MKTGEGWEIWPPRNWPLIGRLFGRKGFNLTWIRGRYEFTWELSRFQPDGSAEWWWTSFSEQSATEAGVLRQAALGQPVEVQLLGGK
jgi:hypothetical protein